MKQVSDHYTTLITPAPYAFAIWGIIYLSFLVYAIYQLLPSQKYVTIYDKLAKPLAFVNFLGSVWIVSFTSEEIAASVLIIFLMWLNGLVLFIRSKESSLVEYKSQLISIPFSLFLGWISVAALVNVGAWLTSIGWQGGVLVEVPWAPLVVILMASLAIIVSFKTKDFLYPLVISWAVIGISVGQKRAEPIIATIALGAGILLILWTAGFVLWVLRQKRPNLYA